MKKINDEGGVGLVAAKMFPGVHLVRGFNAIGSGGLEKNAHRSGEPLGVPITSDDPKAAELAAKLIKDIGFEAGAGGRHGQGQVPGAGHAARRRAYARRDPQDRRHAVVSSTSSAESGAFFRLLQKVVAVRPRGAARGRLVLGLRVRVARGQLHPDADPRPDGRGGRRAQPAVAVRRHAGRHGPAQRAVRLAGEEAAAQPLHPAHLPLLRRDAAAVRRGHALRDQGAVGLGRPPLLHLGIGRQPVRRSRCSGSSTSTCSARRRASGCSASSPPAPPSARSWARPSSAAWPRPCRRRCC